MQYISQNPSRSYNRDIRTHFTHLAEQSEALLSEHHFEMVVEYCGEVTENGWTGDKFALALKNTETGKAMCMNYKTGTGHRKLNMTEEQLADIAKCPRSIYAEQQRQRYTVILPPQPLDVLHCIRLDDPHGYTFDEWCDEYGYDTDSRKALEMYLACQEQTTNFRRTFPGFDLDEYAPLEDY
jgi:hypothetical protein